MEQKCFHPNFTYLFILFIYMEYLKCFSNQCLLLLLNAWNKHKSKQKTKTFILKRIFNIYLFVFNNQRCHKCPPPPPPPLLSAFVSFLFSFTRDLKCYLKSAFHSGLPALGNFGPGPYNFPSAFKEEIYDL